VATAVRKRLGEMLLESGVIDSAQLQSALGHQRRWGGRLGQALVDLKIVTEAQIVEALSRKLGYDSIRLAAVEHGPSLELALRLVPYEFAQRNLLLPYAADMGTVWVAMADPTNVSVVDEVAFRTGRRVKVSLAGDQEIAEAVRRLYLMEKRGIDAIALDDNDEQPVEMVGSFEGGSTQALDEFFSRKPAPPPAPSPPVVADPSPPPNRATQAIPQAGAEARLAEAVRKLKLEDETTASRAMAGRPPLRAVALPAPPPPPPPPAPGPAVLTPLPEADPVSAIDLPPGSELPPEGEVPDLSPRLHALLDALDRAARGESGAPDVARLARLSSALVRLLLRKRVVTETELIAELLRK